MSVPIIVSRQKVLKYSKEVWHIKYQLNQDLWEGKCLSEFALDLWQGMSFQLFTK